MDCLDRAGRLDRGDWRLRWLWSFLLDERIGKSHDVLLSLGFRFYVSGRVIIGFWISKVRYQSSLLLLISEIDAVLIS